MASNNPNYNPNQKKIIYTTKVNKPIIIGNTTGHNIHQNFMNNNHIYNNIDNNMMNVPTTNQYRNVINNVDIIHGSENKNNTLLNTDNIINYGTDPVTAQTIILGVQNNNNNNNNSQKKYDNKTFTDNIHSGNKIYKEIYKDNPKTLNDFNNRREITDTFVGNETISPIIDNFDVNATLFQNEDNYNLTNEFENMKLTASALSVSVLSDIPYKAYPTAKHSKESLGNFAGFGVNSYNGKVKNYNEDRIRVVASHVSQSKIDPNKKINISYFSIFDGHSGKKCSEFLKKQFYDYLINSSFFPDQPLKAINEAFKKAEAQFLKMAYDAKSKTLLDKSGSCAIILLIMDNILYAINLGDSRALYSYDTGRCLLQITRDHKPNDEVERKRIENAGGKIYYANTIKRNGKEIELKEEDFGKDFTFPYRILPGKIAVNKYYI